MSSATIESLRLEPKEEEVTMPWEKMKMQGLGNSLPGDRGRYLLWFEPPIVDGEPRYVHFSWVGESYCVRDYIKQQQTKALGDLGVTDVWNAALDRKPCTGELYVPVENHHFWMAKLTQLSEKRREEPTTSGDWSPLNSGGTSRAEPPKVVTDSLLEKEPGRNDQDPYRRFMGLWADGRGFEVIQRTVGCSARYRGEPLLWVYPRYFQVAPQGKGNAHHEEVRLLMNRYFPEIYKGTISFSSEYFTWDRFEDLVTEVKQMIQN